MGVCWWVVHFEKAVPGSGKEEGIDPISVAGHLCGHLHAIFPGPSGQLCPIHLGGRRTDSHRCLSSTSQRLPTYPRLILWSFEVCMLIRMSHLTTARSPQGRKQEL